ncbi:DNA-binding protein satb2 [Plakobranchus ocellatus]|uniref:DNA-binding protein satb2 n=1 Tax=Plakobranchus ocellatus TaxID=259542 RepID=A0AAV4DKS7_9GAST|nr:DNA-binding protein satb2 [Plakobranchus ocellatus]
MSRPKDRVSRSLPIHCVIEQTSANPSSLQQQERETGVAAPACSVPVVLLDSYAILPGNTPFCDVVAASLCKLGYSNAEAREATGGVQLKNWKTLPLDAVTDRAEATIEEMLGELTSVATLRVQLSSGSRAGPGSDEVKDKLLQLLLTQSKDLLLQAGCPIEKSQLDALSAGEKSQDFSDSVCSAFYEWHTQQVQDSVLLLPKSTSSDTSVVSSGLTSQAISSSAETCSQGTEGEDSGRKIQSSVLVTPSPALLSSLCVRKGQPPDSRAENTTHAGQKPPLTSQCGDAASVGVGYSKLDGSTPSLRAGNHHPATSCENKVFERSLTKDNIFQSKAGLETLPRAPNTGRDAENTQSALHYHMHPMASPVAPTVANIGHSSHKIPSNIPTINGSAGSPYLGLMPGKTRIRTSFDPEHEIPRLHKWFSQNQHPTREQMLRYMHELNGLESRRGRRPLDLTNIIYWFKNARAAQRRACKALDDSLDDGAGMMEEGRSMDESSGGHPQRQESVTDEGNSDDASTTPCGVESGSATEANVPPYLPNKNAVYMIPFHPYLQASPSSHGRMTPPPSAELDSEDQPYDLSLTKRHHSREPCPIPVKRQAKEVGPEGREDTGEGKLDGNVFPGKSDLNASSTFPNGKPSDKENESQVKRRNDSSPPSSSLCLPSSISPLCPPRFPALLDVASKMRQEIPAQSDEEDSNLTLTFPCASQRHSDKVWQSAPDTPKPAVNGDIGYNGLNHVDSSPTAEMDRSSYIGQVEDMKAKSQERVGKLAADLSPSPWANPLHNGSVPSKISAVNLKREEYEKDLLSARHYKASPVSSHAGSSPRSKAGMGNSRLGSHCDNNNSSLELGQISKDGVQPSMQVKHDYSDDEDEINNDDRNGKVYRTEHRHNVSEGRDRNTEQQHSENESSEEQEYLGHHGFGYHNHHSHEQTIDHDTEAELLKLKLKHSKDYVDYASAAAMHSNVSRLTAANMAALSLAQMGGLHLPQLPPSLAMAYYPMDPRFYPAIGPPPPHSSSSPTPLNRSSGVTPSTSPSTISPHLHSHLHPHHADSRSPLPSPSSVSLSQGLPQLNHLHPSHQSHTALSPSPQHRSGHVNNSEPRKRRTRVFIDPLTEIPKLEKWFLEDTHPSAFMIDKFCEELNTCEYRHKFPKLEPKNVQLWFKNHRAKVKRMKTVSSGGDGGGADLARDDFDEDVDD